MFGEAPSIRWCRHLRSSTDRLPICYSTGGSEGRARIHCKPLPVLQIVYCARRSVRLGFVRGRGMAGKNDRAG